MNSRGSIVELQLNLLPAMGQRVSIYISVLRSVAECITLLAYSRVHPSDHVCVQNIVILLTRYLEKYYTDSHPIWSTDAF